MDEEKRKARLQKLFGIDAISTEQINRLKEQFESIRKEFVQEHPSTTPVKDEMLGEGFYKLELEGGMDIQFENDEVSKEVCQRIRKEREFNQSIRDYIQEYDKFIKKSEEFLKEHSKPREPLVLKPLFEEGWNVRRVPK
jgi:hypothetical protein